MVTKKDFARIIKGERLMLEYVVKKNFSVNFVGHFDGIEGDFVMLTNYDPLNSINSSFSSGLRHRDEYALDCIRSYISFDRIKKDISLIS